MTDVTVCLDSGLRATDACKNDIRGDRTETVKCYPEDRPKDSCTTHVELEICSGGGVATEYCKNFASAVHLDYDEANACGFQQGDLGRILQ